MAARDIATPFIPIPGCLRDIFPPQKRPLEQEAAPPSKGWDVLISDRFVAPYEPAPFTDHPPEEILIFRAAAESRVKRLRFRGHYFPFEEDISRPAVPPSDDEPGGVCRSFPEPAFDKPAGRDLLKMRFDRT